MPIFSQFGEIVWQRLFNIVRIIQTTALKPVPVVKDLGVIIDSPPTYNKHVTKTVSDCTHRLIRINRIKHLLDRKTLLLLINAFAFSKLFYCTRITAHFFSRTLYVVFSERHNSFFKSEFKYIFIYLFWIKEEWTKIILLFYAIRINAKSLNKTLKFDLKKIMKAMDRPSRQIASQIFLKKHYEPNKYDFC